MPFIDFTLQQLILRFVALLFIVAVHGLAVAGTARLLGDRGPEYDGRLTPNPFNHLDLLGGLGVVLFSLGWIRRVEVDPAELRPGRAGLVLIVAAATVSTVAAVFLLRLLRPLAITVLPDTAGITVVALINTAGRLGLWFALFNLLPIPPLTGGYLLEAAVPSLRKYFERYHFFLMALLGIFILSGAAGRLFAPAYRAAENVLFGG